LRKLGLADNTLIWFASDNGGITPESQDAAGKGKGNIGVRTQGLLEWPARVKRHIRTEVVCGHVDIYPTLLDITGVTVPGQPPVDGVSLVPLLDGQMTARPRPLGFMLWNGTPPRGFIPHTTPCVVRSRPHRPGRRTPR
jgi:arylsulfatase A-like enzyme